MKRKRAEGFGFKCPVCRQPLHKISSTDWGCLNPECFQNYYEVAHRVKMGVSKKYQL